MVPFFILVVCLPSFIYVVFPAGSLAVGIILIAIATFVLAPPTLTVISISLSYSLILFLSAFFNATYEDFKPAQILVKATAHGFIVCIAVSLGLLLSRLCVVLLRKNIEKIVLVANLLFIIPGLLTVLWRPSFLGYNLYVKNIFPFAEPSHYALAAAPFMLFGAVFLPLPRNIILLTVYVIISLLQPSLILLLVSMVILLLISFRYIINIDREISFDKYVFYAISCILIYCAFIAYQQGVFHSPLPGVYQAPESQPDPSATKERRTAPSKPGVYQAPESQPDPSATKERRTAPSKPIMRYLADRLSISPQSKNLTVLVFLQGWEDAYRSLIETGGAGRGFQSMGTSEPGPIAERIRSIAHMYKNRNDGGSLAPKIVSEFGYIGIGVVAALLGAGVYAFCNLAVADRAKIEPLRAISYCFIVSLVVELFLRGYGYFSPGVFLAIVGLTIIFMTDRQKVSYDNSLGI
ncbi:hypothetical protein [Aurantimonas sp. A3-2-R12]|uniref:hypothetical protein n=1 Tax=Aurantimonas sp. A3-2-R12 TaxID=3114362 RepID=UPI002E19B6DB|nr:hypothetical protein [Aurantimonas sp. A3-2-R12]